MACGRESPPWGQCRTVSGSGGNRRGGAAAAPGATATTAQAGRAHREEPVARRMPKGFLQSCPSLRMRQRMPAIDPRTLASGAKLFMQLEQQFGCRSVSAVDDEAPAQPIGLEADFGAVA